MNNALQEQIGWIRKPKLAAAWVRKAQSALAGSPLPRILWLSQPDEKGHFLFQIQSLETGLQAVGLALNAADERLVFNHTLQELENHKFALDQSSIVAITDPRGVITYVNERFCEISQYSAQELLGRTHKIINSGHHEKGFFKDLWATISAGQVWRGEICNRAKSGNLYWVFTTIVPFLDGKGKPWQFMAIRTDITARKLAEQQAEAQRIKALMAEKFASLGEVAAGVAHELFNPISAIRGRMELLQIQAQKQVLDHKKLEQATTTAIGLLDRMTKIIKAMRALGRDGSQDLPKPVPIANMITEVLEFVYVRFKRHGVEIQIEPFSEGLTAYCRETQILQVLLNLLQNAHDACLDTANKLIRVHIEHTAEYVRFRIVDSGPGVPDTLIEKIFQPFFTTKEVGKGTGLGLSISRSIALEHGGDLRFERWLDKSSFVLELPHHTPSNG
ncbi:MAG: PAS domain-containing sensor histidine kinase [Acidobacteria bacterium]|nr:PAS domain-containing sensor histidine kinase [Acidobacteriota bacterium]MCB9398446.1 PAS domain-containing sensor histidine kinase [Acidobacteriota bacterium]